MPNMIEVTCPQCSTVLSVPVDYVGKQLTCRVCASLFVVPRDADRPTSGPVKGQLVVAAEIPVGPTRPSFLGQKAASPPEVRYRDAYRVASTLSRLGDSIKVGGGILAGLLAIVALKALGSLAFVVVIMAAAVGGFFFVCGVVVAAFGQLLLASLDVAVSSSPFLTDAQRANVMGFPQNVSFGDVSPRT